MPVTPALYFGPTTAFANPHPTPETLNAAITLSPRARGQVAIGSFSYNVYVSSLVDTSAITSAHVRLYCGPTGFMKFPAWFAQSQLINQWTWRDAGSFNSCSPPPPVANYTWDAVSDAQIQVPPVPTPLIWTPDANCPVYNCPFSLIATIEYDYNNVTYTVGSGQAAKDPRAAVLCSLSF